MDENIKYSKEIKDSQPSLGTKEIKALKKSKYRKINKDFHDVFILKNNKTNMIVEIKASTSLHACHIIGWRPKHVTVLEHRKVSSISTNQSSYAK